MDFALSEEQELLQATLRGFVEKECPPSVVRAIFDAPRGAASSLWKGLVEMGIAGLLVPEEHGGAGLELLDLALVAEELGRGCVPAPFLGHSLATLAVTLGGSPAQQERWLPGLAGGEKLGSVALAEPGGAWEPSSWSLALRDGCLHGTKEWVPDAASADLLVVGTAGGGLAVVETGARGVAISHTDTVDRTRPLDRLSFDAAAADPLAGPGAAEAAGRVRDAGLVLLAADAFGVGYGLVRSAAEYAGSRQQFGQPIGQFQALKHQLANMALEVDPTRSLWWYAAHAFDHLPAESTRAAALAKAHITDRVMSVARRAVEAHGGIGFTWEGDVQIAFKRAMFDRTWLGVPTLHRERIADLGGW